MKRAVVILALVMCVGLIAADVHSQGNRCTEPKATDPVCGLCVEKNPELSARHNGQTYYFCSATDLKKFREEPDRYARKR